MGAAGTRRPHLVGEPLDLRRVVVVRKTTVIEQLDQRPDPKLEAALSAGLPVAARIRRAHVEHTQTVAHVLDVLQQHHIEVRVLDNLNRREADRVDLVVTVGGDGTFLRASHCIDGGVDDNGPPMLGVNSALSSSIGFFCAADADDFSGILDAVQSGAQRSRALWRMRVVVNGKPLPDLALNDVLIAHSVPAETTRYKITVDGVTQTQKSSGIWVATAAGTTAAIRSAGGFVLPLEDRRLQYRVRELFPVAMADEPLTGGVVEDCLELHSHMRAGVLFIDGGHRRIQLGFGDSVAFVMAATPLPWIASPVVDARRERVAAAWDRPRSNR